MLCPECKKKPISRGIRHISCVECGKDTTVNIEFNGLCEECSDKLEVCQRCSKGGKIKKLSIPVDLKGTEEFTSLLTLVRKVLTDERIVDEVRKDYETELLKLLKLEEKQ